jgi:hypothetical protein
MIHQNGIQEKKEQVPKAIPSWFRFGNTLVWPQGGAGGAHSAHRHCKSQIQ